MTAAPTGFDARAARSRTYRYRLWLSDVRPVHERAYVWNVRGRVDATRFRLPRPCSPAAATSPPSRPPRTSTTTA